MDNRFKYRVWNKYHKQMYDVYQIDFNYDLIFCDSKEGTTHTFGFIDCILMQCTGLKDKNGVLIFEGDIIRVENIDHPKLHNLSYKVVYKDNYQGLLLIGIEMPFHQPSFDSMCIRMEKKEITGTIHD